MIRKFWWGNGDSRKIHWVKWSSLCSSKSMGGMGFHDFQKFNNALLAKQVWHLLHKKNTLLFKVFSAKYFPIGIIFEDPVHLKCSYAWRSILKARDVINQGAFWRVGSGQLIDIWKHQWLPNFACSKVISPRIDSPFMRVCDLLFPGTRIWDLGRLAACFLPWEAEMVVWILLCEDWDEDILIWLLTSDGEYNVRSAYCMLASMKNSPMPSYSSSNPSQAFWKAIWKIWVSKENRHFIWWAVKDSLPTKQNLKIRHFQVVNNIK